MRRWSNRHSSSPSAKVASKARSLSLFPDSRVSVSQVSRSERVERCTWILYADDREPLYVAVKTLSSTLKEWDDTLSLWNSMDWREGYDLRSVSFGTRSDVSRESRSPSSLSHTEKIMLNILLNRQAKTRMCSVLSVEFNNTQPWDGNKRYLLQQQIPGLMTIIYSRCLSTQSYRKWHYKIVIDFYPSIPFVAHNVLLQFQLLIRQAGQF